jgi:(2R)-sulfolactate sulfo-lyase subunit beta
MSIPKFIGYRRENGRVGVRNHTIILPLDDLSNAASEAVANHIKGTLALPHPYGRLQFGEDLELFFRTLIGTGTNPNVAAVIVIGIEPEWTSRVVEGIAESGKPVKGFSIERDGDINTVAKASRQAMEYVQWTSELQRSECSLDELYVSTKCGESDTTSGLASNPTVGNVFDKLNEMGATTCFGETSEIMGAELICKERAASAEVGEAFMRTFNAYNDIILANKTDDLSGSQPTKGNIRGGLTTIEEKAFGNLQKIGKKSSYVGVLKPAEAPTGPGMWFMEKGEVTRDEAGDQLIDMILRTSNGRRTAAEALGHREFVLTKLYISA